MTTVRVSVDVLRELQDTCTITMAVYGESDDADVQRYLEPQRVVQFAGNRIGLIHGHQAEPESWWRRLLRMGPARDAEATRRGVLAAFEGVSCIVYGHTHRPYARMHGGVLLFNPGPAAPLDGQRPSVGILEIDAHSIAGRIVYLDEV